LEGVTREIVCEREHEKQIASVKVKSNRFTVIVEW
jgi:hypothetical protein